MKKKLYLLGRGFKASDDSRSYPYEICLDPESGEFPIVILEGKGMGGVGGSFRAEEFLQEKWKDHIALTKTEWLIPLCEEAVKNDEALDADLVIQTYRHVNNKEVEEKS